MKTSNKVRVGVIAFALVILLALWAFAPKEAKSDVEIATTTPAVVEEPVGPVLSHRQEVWRYVLEWCESRAVHTAINEVDKDGTASYYAFQFKPGTFRYYGELYGVIPKGLDQAALMEALKSYEQQKEIVGYMILDPSVDWLQQFPDCVRKYGLPPKE